LVGTPSNATWPGVEELPQWKNWKGVEFEDYPGESIAKVVPRLDKDGIDLLEVVFI
jgi:hypothetical protein